MVDNTQTATKTFKFIPGKKEIRTCIRTIDSDNEKIDKEIKETLESIKKIIKEENEKSEKGRLLYQHTTFTTEIKKLRNIKKEKFNKIKLLKEEMEVIRKELSSKDKESIGGGSSSDGNGRSKYRTIEDIESRMNILNGRLIAETLSTVEETKIAQELGNLQSRKYKVGESQDNYKKLSIKEGELNLIKKELIELNGEISKKQNEINILNEKIEILNKDSKNKNPIILKFDESILRLREKRKVLNEQRKKKLEELFLIEEEFKKLEQSILIAQEIESKKDLLKIKINKKKLEIENLNKKAEKFNPEILKDIFNKISKSIKEGNFNLPIELVASLLKYKISIPKDLESGKKTLIQISDVKDNFKVKFKEFNSSIKKEIDLINVDISKISSELKELPETDYELLKKGGDYNNNNKKKGSNGSYESSKDHSYE